MKIEQIDPNQIRCTLTRDDLARRNMKISELAYGTEKARGLFHDMMREAALQFGFDAGDTPIMVEAVPMNAECLVLVITKVEDPEELDTRFSNFSPSLDISAQSDPYDFETEDAEEDFFSVFSHIRETSFSNYPDPRLFSFGSLHEVTAVAKSIHKLYNGRNSLYNDAASGRYLLLLTPEEAHPEHIHKVSARLSEYGRDEQRLFSGATAKESYLDEHFSVVIRDEAVQKLSSM